MNVYWGMSVTRLRPCSLAYRAVALRNFQFRNGQCLSKLSVSNL